jgi:hypothetical protein
MGDSVSDSTAASRGRPARAEPAASDGGVDHNRGVPDEANESVSARLGSPPCAQPAPPRSTLSTSRQQQCVRSWSRLMQHTPKRAATSYLDGGTSQTGRVTVDPLHRWRRAPQPPQQRSHGGYSRTRTGLRPDGPASTCGAWFSGDSKGTRYQGSASRAPHLQCSGYARSLPFGSAA